MKIPLLTTKKMNYSNILHELYWMFRLKNKDTDFKKALNNRIALSLIGLSLNETFSEKSFSQKKQRISEILHDNLYQKAYQGLTLKYFPIHWKLFFYFAKTKNASGIVILSKIINFLINKS